MTRRICHRATITNGHRMIMQLVIILVFTLRFVTLRGHNVVHLPEGEIIGTTMITRKGRNISAYLGIPYAQPPVGPLRFKNLEPLSEFGSVLPGDTHSDVCPQLNDDEEFTGAEDCLYLNVYTPEAIPESLYPVMVFIHGGKFAKRSSKEASPENLLDKNVVLVSFNYRLGVLGFLSTGDVETPGNSGLKDQVVALRWVRDHISAFGGDSNRVTIFGHSAGGASTRLHAMSPASRGLFQQYISQSSDEFDFWAFRDIERYANYSTSPGKKFDCPTGNSRVLIDCLRDIDVHSLVNSYDIFDNEFWAFRTWGPTIETIPTDGAFLTEFPMTEVLMNGINDVPSMIGNVADDGLTLMADLYVNNTVYDTIASNTSGFFVFVTKLLFTDHVPEIVAKRAEHFYLNGTDSNDRNAFIQGLTKFISDVAFIIPSEHLIRVTKRDARSPVYEYSFDYRGTFSQTSLKIGSNENIGVDHGDELIYLFPMNGKLKTSSDLRFSESDEKMIDNMIDLWTSFVSTGTPIASSTSHPYIWEPYDDSKMNYLKIGNQSDPDLTTQHELRMKSNRFWNSQLGPQFSISIR